MDNFLALLQTGKYLPAIGLVLIALVGAMRAGLGAHWPWFKTKPGGYALGFGSAAMLYLGTSLQAGNGITIAVLACALAAGWTASGGWESARDIVIALRKPTDTDGAGSIPKATVVSLGGLAASVAIVALLVGCSSCKRFEDAAGTAPGSAIIDCTLENKGQLDSASKELRDLLFGQTPNWSAIGAKAKEFGINVGGCVLAELVQNYLSGRKAIPVEESHAASDTLERFRATYAGGATFHTASGDL